MRRRPGSATGGAAVTSRALPLPAMTRDTSRSVAIARVVCILFMMTNHIWPGSERVLAAVDGPVETVFYDVVVDHLGRASVPLLSLFSGLLFVGTFARAGGPLPVLAGKFRSLIVPMALWSLPMLVLLHLKGIYLGQPFDWPDSLRDWGNALFAIRGFPANTPLLFLREIFVMCVLGAGVLLLWRRSPVAGVALALLILVLMHRPGGFILFRSFIGTAFFLGMGVALAGRANWAPSWPLVLGVLVLYLALFFSGLFAVRTGPAGISEGYTTRIAMCLLMWRVCRDMAEGKAEWLTGKVLALEPHIFIIFCTHAITAFFVGGLADVMGWHETDRAYVILFLGQIVLIVVAGVIASKLVRPFPILSGGRKRSGILAGRG